MSEWSKTPPFNQYHPALSLHIRRGIINLERVDGLIFAYEGIKHKITRLDPIDILRAAAIFLHAGLEDTLRSIATMMLPLAGREVLNQIPLGDSRQPEKFLLGALTPFRGKSIDEVLKDRVWHHYQQVSVSSVCDIAALLAKLEIDFSEFDRFFVTIEEMIERRHRIVHRADLEHADLPAV